MRAESPPYSELAAAYASGGELNFSRRMARWILRTLCCGEVGSVLDIACGAGEAVRVFRDAGWEAVGLDKSDSMLRLARSRNGLGAQFRRGTMQKMARVRARFDLVTCMYDAINCNLRVKDLFATFRNAFLVLAPRGRFVFDAYTRRGLLKEYGAGLEVHTRNREHIVFSTARLDRSRHIGTKEFVGASRKRKWRAWKEVHQVRAFSTRVLLQGLSKAQFASVAMYGWPGGGKVHASRSDDLDRIVIVAQRGEGG